MWFKLCLTLSFLASIFFTLLGIGQVSGLI